MPGGSARSWTCTPVLPQGNGCSSSSASAPVLQKETLVQAQECEAASVPVCIRHPPAACPLSAGSHLCPRLEGAGTVWDGVAWPFHRDAGSAEGCCPPLSSPNTTSGGMEGWCGQGDVACSEQSYSWRSARSVGHRAEHPKITTLCLSLSQLGYQRSSRAQPHASPLSALELTCTCLPDTMSP